MTHPKTYFKLARSEEKSDNASAALIHYLSSFCAHYNQCGGRPTATVSKIRKIQAAIGLSDRSLCEMARSYGPLSDEECQQLLYFAINGYVGGMHAVLSDG
ncbi:MAG: hypothetical protein IJ679_08255 [Lachnospiraceae bacterium]|nr:hypothetical protein [Lachnospiraceae bacterium]